LAEVGLEIQTGTELTMQHIEEADGVNRQDVILVTGLDEPKNI